MLKNKQNYNIEYVGSIAGILSIVLYIASVAFSFLPDTISRLFSFAFPLLWIISFLGLYKFLSKDYLGASLKIAVVFGVIGGAVACMFLVIQQGNWLWYEQSLQEGLPIEEKQFNKAVFIAVDKVQAYMDVAFDIFILIAWILFGLNISKSPHFNRILGYTGSLIALSALLFNLYTFPHAPADSGLIDLGPFLGIWALVFYISFLLKVKNKSQTNFNAVDK